MRLKSLLNKFKLKELATQKLHWNFLPLWIVTTAFSYAIGGRVSAFVTDWIMGDLGVWLSFGLMSLAIAFSQWLVIRKYIVGFSWFWATLIGGTVGGSVSSWASFQLAITYGDALDLVVVYACLRGLSVGVMQWIILKQYFRRSEWWIVVSTASWYGGVWVGWLLINKLGYFLTLTIGAIYGLLTGIALLLMFRNMIKIVD
ncbi:MAG: hypothetical protein DCE90_07920 [Pseudanabaena sp.]|nr:MAG: hypothetical protein DCE90_07920 [Pseudanabaena sp.]